MCCAHLLRELTGFFENHPEIESRQNYIECLKRNYDRILEKGAAQNPLPEKESGKRGRVKRGKIRALIDRLQTHKGEVCRFVDDPIVPFTNNQAERDLRMVRMKSKVIGTFRLEQGAKDFLLLEVFDLYRCKSRIHCFRCTVFIVLRTVGFED